MWDDMVQAEEKMYVGHNLKQSVWKLTSTERIWQVEQLSPVPQFKGRGQWFQQVVTEGLLALVCSKPQSLGV